MNPEKIKYPLIGGLIGLFIIILFVILKLGGVIFILSYPITALSCFIILRRMCYGQEGMIIFLTGPLTGLLIGTLMGYLFYKFKNK